MKKIIIGAFVLGIFVIYSLHQRSEGSAAMVASKPIAQSTMQATPSSAATTATSTSDSVAYKDGQYTGTAADAYYGNIQVQATVQGGKLTDVQFLQYPSEQHNSVEINSQAMPLLKQEAIQAQSAHVNTITGATDTSQAFVQSLSAALMAAKA